MSTDLEGWYMGKRKVLSFYSVPFARRLRVLNNWGIAESHFGIGNWEFDEKLTFSNQIERVISVHRSISPDYRKPLYNEEQFRQDGKDFAAEALRRKLPIRSYWV